MCLHMFVCLLVVFPVRVCFVFSWSCSRCACVSCFHHLFLGNGYLFLSVQQMHHTAAAKDSGRYSNKN